MYKKITFTILLAVAILFGAGTTLFANDRITVTDTDPQVGTTAKGTYMQAILLDSITNAPIEFATMSGKYIGEKTATRYALSDQNGVVLVPNMRVGRATVVVEYMGYKTKTFIFDIKKGANNIGKIYLQEDVNLLDAIVVTDVANPMVVKKDTLEYNVAAVKVNDTDMLEELLKKLPGVEIDSDGKITANGKEIKKIQIEGKTFFLDDPQLATKNLPAKIIDKVRVVEKKSDQAEFTGIDDGEEETVIDLGIKKGMMNGWFGNLMGGYGTEDRYQAAGMLGRFTEKSQVSVIGNANNTNNRGFMDMAGSMMGGMRGGRGMGGGRGGMMTGNGITESWMGGVNAGTEVLDGKMELLGNYMYSGSDKNVQEKKVKETMLSDNNTLYNYENGYELSRTDGHRFGGEVRYTISKNTSLIFRPSFNFTGGDFESYNDFITLNNADSTNKGISKDWGGNNAQQAEGSLVFRQRLGKPGRTLSVRLNYGYSNNELDGGVYSNTSYYKDNLVDSLAIVDQRYFQREKSYNFGGRISYVEPMGKNFFLEGAYRYSYKGSNSDKDTYNKGMDGMYDLLDTTYSSHYENVFIQQQAELNFMKQESKYNLTVGVSMQPSTTKSYGRGRDTSYSVINFSTSARFDYKITDEKSLRIRYRGRTSQPSLNQLLPIPDNTNPLKVTIGNMNLNPEFTHSMNLEYTSGNRRNFSFFGTFIDASYTTDKIVSRSWYDENGVQYTQPYNDATGVYSINGRVMYNSKIAKSNFSISSMTFVRFGNSIAYVYDSGDYVKNITESLSLMEHLNLTYRNDFIEVRAGGRVNYQNAWYSVQSVDKVATWTNAITGSVNATIPGGINVTTDIAHTFYIGYGEGYGDNSTVWNAEISKQLFKNQITLKAKIYDILKDAKNTYRTTTENYIQDIENNTLGQYIMISLTWRFGKFSGGPGMGRGGMMRGGGPMGGGPMGGPMGGRR